MKSYLRDTNRSISLTNMSLLVVPTIAPIPNNEVIHSRQRNKKFIRATIEQIPIPVFLIRVGNNSLA